MVGTGAGVGCTVPTGVVVGVPAGTAGGVTLVVGPGVATGLGCAVAPDELPANIAAAHACNQSDLSCLM